MYMNNGVSVNTRTTITTPTSVITSTSTVETIYVSTQKAPNPDCIVYTANSAITSTPTATSRVQTITTQTNISTTTPTIKVDTTQTPTSSSGTTSTPTASNNAIQTPTCKTPNEVVMQTSTVRAGCITPTATAEVTTTPGYRMYTGTVIANAMDESISYTRIECSDGSYMMMWGYDCEDAMGDIGKYAYKYHGKPIVEGYIDGISDKIEKWYDNLWDAPTTNNTYASNVTSPQSNYDADFKFRLKADKVTIGYEDSYGFYAGMTYNWDNEIFRDGIYAFQGQGFDYKVGVDKQSFSAFLGTSNICNGMYLATTFNVNSGGQIYFNANYDKGGAIGGALGYTYGGSTYYIDGNNNYFGIGFKYAL